MILFARIHFAGIFWGKINIGIRRSFAIACIISTRAWNAAGVAIVLGRDTPCFSFFAFVYLSDSHSFTSLPHRWSPIEYLFQVLLRDLLFFLSSSFPSEVTGSGYSGVLLAAASIFWPSGPGFGRSFLWDIVNVTGRHIGRSYFISRNLNTLRHKSHHIDILNLLPRKSVWGRIQPSSFNFLQDNDLDI